MFFNLRNYFAIFLPKRIRSIFIAIFYLLSEKTTCQARKNNYCRSVILPVRVCGLLFSFQILLKVIRDAAG